MKIRRLPFLGNVGRLGGKGDSVSENPAIYRTEPVAVDPDSDSDFDREDEKPQQAAARNALTAPLVRLDVRQ